jgi:hypothetical protein
MAIFSIKYFYKQASFSTADLESSAGDLGTPSGISLLEFSVVSDDDYC